MWLFQMTQFSSQHVRWHATSYTSNSMESSALFRYLWPPAHPYIHTDNMQLLRMRKRRKKKQLLSPNSRESCAYEMHKLCFHRRSVSQGDGFSLPCCSLIAILMLLSSPKFSSKQFRNVTTEGGKYLISWLSILGHSLLNWVHYFWSIS